MQRRRDKPHCGRCGCHHFWRGATALGRPKFVCASCGDEWTCGDSGGEYVGREVLNVDCTARPEYKKPSAPAPEVPPAIEINGRTFIKEPKTSKAPPVKTKSRNFHEPHPRREVGNENVRKDPGLRSAIRDPGLQRDPPKRFRRTRTVISATMWLVGVASLVLTLWGWFAHVQ